MFCMKDEDYEEKAVLEQVFGASSSDSEEGSDWEECKWESIEEVKGLWLCTRFLSPRQQTRLLSAIQAENWFSQPSINQAMRFGLQHLPPWAIRLAHSIHRSVLATQAQPFPLHLLQREPLFDQMIANVYQPGEGICAHVDLLRFDDGIAIVSLESSCVMHFTPHSESQHRSVSVPVLLTPGSLVLMSGEARYRWKHEINRKPGFQLWQGQPLTQTRRTSITLRKLLSSSDT
ncbi:alkylated DNA repair protein ALKBH8 homolog [Abrus precatorius]|uniref:Alkylated DNA repair protein ALKBH8 homolog n=1 Tax=Abrus precatorius TaxID=3816 RepID=A0A8B8JS75_ABRPR|nr:alkylated DNA repair protein ALKBH8 homolog [Abrus precatorius]